MNTIWTIVKKELKRFFTDPRMLVSLFLPGILIFVIYTLMGDIMTNVISPKVTDFNVYVVNEPNEFSSFLQVEGWNITLNEENLSKEEILEKIKEKEVDLYVVYEENFYSKMMAYDSSSSSRAPQIEIYYNTTNDASGLIYSYYTGLLGNVESSLANKFDINSDPSISFDLATNKDTTVYIISMMLPFLLILFLFSGAMAICSESIAGEKERGTIATLLITPAKRSYIVLGKIISLGITGLASSLVSFLGLILSLPSLMGTSFDFSAYGATTIILILLLIVVTVLMFTTILTIVSTFAKSVKEATSYSTPIMIVVMLVGLSNFMTTSVVGSSLVYLIPIYNVMQCLVSIFSLSVDYINFTICIVSNVIYIALGVFLLTKMFNNEKIIFNK